MDRVVCLSASYRIPLGVSVRGRRAEGQLARGLAKVLGSQVDSCL